jgi:hypothetical protein
MKSLHFNFIKIIFSILLILWSFANILMSQNLVKSSTPINPYYTTPFNESSGNLLFGTGKLLMGNPIEFSWPYPNNATLHIISGPLGFTTNPLLTTKVQNQYGLNVLVQHCLEVDGIKYGIYQTSSLCPGLKNYFQDQVKICKIELRNGSFNKSVIALDPVVSSLDFVMDPGFPSADPITPLSITPLGITVQPKLITDQIQILTTPGVGKVLASDAQGNGTWTDISLVNSDYWRPCQVNSIYTAYDRVGIGTNNPSGKLEVAHSDNKGGIIINQLHERYTSEIKFKSNDAEQWAIGSYLNEDRPNSFFIWNHLKNRTALYINEDNEIGIDTEWPTAKLEVLGDFRATAIGIGIHPPPDSSEYRLWVEGGIAAREVKVTIYAFPDYVFSGSYKLLSTDELEKYIIINKHLPGIPSSEEVAKNNGVELGAMQVKLLEKIEEQTLYILDMQKQVNDLKKQMERLIKN